MTCKVKSTDYDDVHRTILTDCPRLAIPVVNEAFGTKYTGREAVVLGQNEHFPKSAKGIRKKRIMDSYLMIKGGQTVKRYHVESQSRPDSTIVKRMYEYDSQVAGEEGVVLKNGLEVTIPESAVIYLRHTKNTPDALRTIIKTPGGNAAYEIPVIKIQKYTVGELFEKQLFFFIPFHIFVYENQFLMYNENREELLELQKIYADIMQRLEQATAEGILNEYERVCIVEMSVKVLNKIAEKYENVRKGLGEIMGGKVLDYPAKHVYNEGRECGRAEGALSAYVNMIKKGLISLVAAAQELGMTEEELKARM